ncbi:MAG: tRNA 2-selenouridine(34) synthase MnmH, partial [Bacteroidetes bacterium]|nr:tRNA 2-selenouridine(34) synthase MnmH [Bacteroidota bacterium]
MESIVTADLFLQTQNERVILDVRSPGEFAQGHIPGAISFPLFSDAERAAVGTCYKQKGPEQALELGLQFVGPKMAGFVHDAKALAPARKLGVHCWRGGKRSQSMAWLLRTAGLDVITLEGGYKAYRQYIRSQFETIPLKLFVLGGRTGSGKTKILKAMAQMGAQVLDLEGLAHHKGSAFGFIGELEQPTVEQFENDVYAALQPLDLQKPVWVENESRSIGRVFIPDGLWLKIKAAPLYNIEIPHTTRVQHLIEDYANAPMIDLVQAFHKIDRKLGGQHLKAALEALEQGDFG